jgi:glycosidase
VLSVLGNDREAFELAVLLQATLPGAPCVYYGDEVGVEGGIDPDSRRSFPWDEGRWDHELLGAVRDAFALRRAEPALRADGVEITATAASAIVFRRRGPARALVVALNAGDEPITLPVPPSSEGGLAKAGDSVALAMGRARHTLPLLAIADGRPTIELAPRSGAVVRLA